MFCVLVNENMLDAGARILQEESLDGVAGGWEFVWSVHETRQEAEAELPQAADFAATKRLP